MTSRLENAVICLVQNFQMQHANGADVKCMLRPMLSYQNVIKTACKLDVGAAIGTCRMDSPGWSHV